MLNKTECIHRIENRGPNKVLADRRFQKF